MSSVSDFADALADAREGDTIILSAGDYETLSLDSTLTDVTIEAEDGAVVDKIIIAADASLTDVTIAGMDVNYVDSSSAYLDGGFIAIKAGAEVKTLVIADSVLSGSGGRSSVISVREPSAEITISNCVLDGTKYGVYGSAPIAKLTVEDCEIKNISSWAIMMNGSDGVGAELTITGNTFDNCTGGIAKYLGSSVVDGSFTTFANNDLTGSTGHDGADAKWFTIPAGGVVTVSGNTLDGSAWTPGVAQGLK